MFSALILSAVIQQTPVSVLVFTKTAGYRHDSIETGVAALKELAKDVGIRVEHTEDASVFNDDKLKSFSAIVFLSTTGDILNPDEQEAMVRFVRRGGGFMGIHAAADTEYDWPWYGQLVGGWFKSHPRIQEARIRVLDRQHPATRHLGAEWVRTDEWYDYKALPPTGTRILMELDESSYEGHQMGLDSHPIAWCREFEGGRTFYTGGGHTKESYAEPKFQQHLLGGLMWVLKRS